MKFITISLSLFLGTIVLAQDSNSFVLLKNMYSSHRANARGDLLTVTISERTTSKKEESLSTAKEASAAANAPSLGDANGRTLSKKLAQLDIPQVSFNGTSTFTGSGSMSSEEELVTSMTVRVIDTLPNGVMIIRGERKVKIKKETLTIVMTGLVRPRDVDSDNTITSSQISDFSISYESEGFVTRNSSPGWLTRFFSFINPY